MKMAITGVASWVLATVVAQGAAGSEGAAPLSVETFARDEIVIPLSYEHGGFHCIHLKPPALLLRNTSAQHQTIERARLVGKSGSRELATATLHEEGIAALMVAQNKRMNGYFRALEEPETARRLLRIYGEPVEVQASYHEGHVLPPGVHACLDLSGALYFSSQSSEVIDELVVEIDARSAGGMASSVSFDLPYEPFVCHGDYHFPIAGSSVVGSLPIGFNHRFGNAQEFALDIFDIRRNADGGFSSSRVSSPMVIGGSEVAADYYIYGREVRALAAGEVLEISDRYPDEFAADPREPFQARNERLRQHLIAKGADPDDLPGSNFVLIDHGQGEFARYCHLRDEILVEAGERVEKGQVIGYVGNSGQSTEPHLHLELLDSPDIHAANGLPIIFANLDLSRALDSPALREKNSLVFSEFVFLFSD
jgi:hypothetical protein